MIRQWHDPASVAALFQDWDETMIRSCLQQLMGALYVAEPGVPASVCAQLGCFAFYAGRPNAALLQARPKGSAVLTPQNEAWDRLIGQQLPEARHVTRYAMRKDTRFDRKKLRALASQLPAGYLLRRIDGALYTQCLADPATADFVSAFDSRAHYLEYGRGVVILKGGRIVSGASSYSRYLQGIEIEVDTIEPERRRHLAQTACAALILLCLDEGLYPSWDAQNPGSVRLAETLGYEVSHAYPAYELFTPPQP